RSGRPWYRSAHPQRPDCRRAERTLRFPCRRIGRVGQRYAPSAEFPAPACWRQCGSLAWEHRGRGPESGFWRWTAGAGPVVWAGPEAEARGALAAAWERAAAPAAEERVGGPDGPRASALRAAVSCSEPDAATALCGFCWR